MLRPLTDFDLGMVDERLAQGDRLGGLPLPSIGLDEADPGF
jgi:hypothetical protein